MVWNNVSIIYNPKSTGSAEGRARRLQRTLAAKQPDVPVQLSPTEYAGHATSLAYDIATRYAHPLIISASGDGGYNEVINGALRAQSEGAQPICAVLPAGNANDHARTMHGKPLAELILAECVTSLDVLQVVMSPPDGPDETRYAHSYIGLGLSPQVANELDKSGKNSSVKEALVILRTLNRLQPVELRIAGKVRRFDSLICGIIPEMAKVFTISDAARPDDGRFELLTVEHGSRLHLVQQILKGVFSQLGARSRIGDFACTVLEDSRIQFDGEVVRLQAFTDLSVTIRPALLRTIAEVPPAGPAATSRARREAASPKLTAPFRKRNRTKV